MAKAGGGKIAPSDSLAAVAGKGNDSLRHKGGSGSKGKKPYKRKKALKRTGMMNGGSSKGRTKAGGDGKKGKRSRGGKGRIAKGGGRARAPKGRKVKGAGGVVHVKSYMRVNAKSGKVSTVRETDRHTKL